MRSLKFTNFLNGSSLRYYQGLHSFEQADSVSKVWHRIKPELIKNFEDLAARPEAAKTFCAQLDEAFSTDDTGALLKDSSQWLMRLSILPPEAAIPVVEKIKALQTVYKESHKVLSDKTFEFALNDRDYLIAAFTADKDSLKFMPKHSQELILDVIGANMSPKVLMKLHPDLQSSVADPIKAIVSRFYIGFKYLTAQMQYELKDVIAEKRVSVSYLHETTQLRMLDYVHDELQREPVRTLIDLSPIVQRALISEIDALVGKDPSLIRYVKIEELQHKYMEHIKDDLKKGLFPEFLAHSVQLALLPDVKRLGYILDSQFPKMALELQEALQDDVVNRLFWGHAKLSNIPGPWQIRLKSAVAICLARDITQLPHVSKDLVNDPKFIAEVLIKNPRCLKQFCAHPLCTQEMALKAVDQDPLALLDAGPLVNDELIKKAALSRALYSYKHPLSKEQKELVKLIAVKEPYASSRLFVLLSPHDDPEFIEIFARIVTEQKSGLSNIPKSFQPFLKDAICHMNTPDHFDIRVIDPVLFQDHEFCLKLMEAHPIALIRIREMPHVTDLEIVKSYQALHQNLLQLVGYETYKYIVDKVLDYDISLIKPGTVIFESEVLQRLTAFKDRMNASDLLKFTNIDEAIKSFGNEEIRFCLLKSLLASLQQKALTGTSVVRVFDTLNPGPSLADRTVTLVDLYSKTSGIDRNAQIWLHNYFLKHKSQFKESRTRQQLIDFLTMIAKVEPKLQKRLIDHVLVVKTAEEELDRPADEVKKLMQALCLYSRLKSPESLGKLSSLDIDTILKESFDLLAELGFVEPALKDAFKAVVLSSRRPEAFFVYIGQNKSNPDSARRFKVFSSLLAQGTFDAWRKEHNSYKGLLETAGIKDRWDETLVDDTKKITTADASQAVVIFDSSSSQDLFLCGTEIEGSCQNVYASESTNRCLLGYVLDGKIKMICVKNKDEPEGAIRARAALKVVKTAGGAPALVLEPTYLKANFDPALYEEKIKEFAKSKASLMGIDLYECSETGACELISDVDNTAGIEYEDGAMSFGDAISTGHYRLKADKVV